MTRVNRKRQMTVAIVGFVIIGALSFVVPWVWWVLALACIVPYGVAIWLAGRLPDGGHPVR
jgi:hypothetical protein